MAPDPRFESLRRRVEAEIVGTDLTLPGLGKDLGLGRRQGIYEFLDGEGWAMALRQIERLHVLEEKLELGRGALLRVMGLVDDPADARSLINGDGRVPPWARRAMVILYDASVESAEQSANRAEKRAGAKPAAERQGQSREAASSIKARVRGKKAEEITKAARKVAPPDEPKPPKR